MATRSITGWGEGTILIGSTSLTFAGVLLVLRSGTTGLKRISGSSSYTETGPSAGAGGTKSSNSQSSWRGGASGLRRTVPKISGGGSTAPVWIDSKSGIVLMRRFAQSVAFSLGWCWARVHWAASPLAVFKLLLLLLPLASRTLPCLLRLLRDDRPVNGTSAGSTSMIGGLPKGCTCSSSTPSRQIGHVDAFCSHCLVKVSRTHGMGDVLTRMHSAW